MKTMGVSKKQLFLGVFCLVMLIIGALSWGIRKSETPVRLDRVIDGDTIVFSGGKTVGLLGIDVSLGGQVNAELIKQYLSILLANKNIWLEYDRYGKDLAWVWVGCESSPKFWAVRGVGENPVGCKKGVLVNEQIIKMGWSKVYFLDENGRNKYWERLVNASAR